MSLARAEADLVSARNEVRRYENLLENARQKALKIEHYIEMARLYAGGSDEQDGSYSHRQRSGVSGSAVTEVISYLREVGRAVKTRDLVPMLKAKNIVVSPHPDREVTVLSGYLSRAPELVGNRVEGWWLAEWGSPIKPSDASGASNSELESEMKRPTDAWEAPHGDFKFTDWALLRPVDLLTDCGPDKPKLVNPEDDIPF